MKKALVVTVAATVMACSVVATASVASAGDGKKALSPAAVAVLKDAQLDYPLLGESTVRLAGADRYETAATFASRFWNQETAVVVYLAVGTRFPDALSVASSRGGGPVLLTESNRLPDSTRAVLSELRPCVIYVVGGTDAVSDAVALDADQYTDIGRCHE